MSDLADGMRVAVPEGFVLNGRQPRSPLRASHEAVSCAVSKMLGAVIKQRSAFILPLELAPLSRSPLMQSTLDNEERGGVMTSLGVLEQRERHTAQHGRHHRRCDCILRSHHASDH